MKDAHKNRGEDEREQCGRAIDSLEGDEAVRRETLESEDENERYNRGGISHKGVS